MSEQFGYERLTIWQEGVELAAEVYGLTTAFPKSELFGLTSQMRRAATSVPANIAEGYGRATDPQLANFVHNARGSLFELRTLLKVAERVGIVSGTGAEATKSRCVRLSQQIDAFLKTLHRKSPDRGRRTADGGPNKTN